MLYSYIQCLTKHGCFKDLFLHLIHRFFLAAPHFQRFFVAHCPGFEQKFLLQLKLQHRLRWLASAGLLNKEVSSSTTSSSFQSQCPTDRAARPANTASKLSFKTPTDDHLQLQNLHFNPVPGCRHSPKPANHFNSNELKLILITFLIQNKTNKRS